MQRYRAVVPTQLQRLAFVSGNASKSGPNPNIIIWKRFGLFLLCSIVLLIYNVAYTNDGWFPRSVGSGKAVFMSDIEAGSPAMSTVKTNMRQAKEVETRHTFQEAEKEEGPSAGLVPPTMPVISQAVRPQLRWAIVVLADDRSKVTYEHHLATFECYAKRHGYKFIVDANDALASKQCSGFANFFFRKHCRVAELLQGHPDIDWFAVLDGDNFVINATTPLDVFVPVEDPAQTYVVHYERFHNGEIAAGNYLVRNTGQAITYLQQWAAYENNPDGTANADNGALHVHILATLSGDKSVSAGYQRCYSLWNQQNAYDSYIACVKCQFGSRRYFPERGVLILRRGHAFTRDFFVTNPGKPETDGIAEANVGDIVVGDACIMFHGWKDSLLTWFAEDVSAETCGSDPAWTPKLRSDVVVEAEVGKQKLQQREQFAFTHRQGVIMKDVGDCWPNCPLNLSQEQVQAAMAGRCSAFGMDGITR